MSKELSSPYAVDELPASIPGISGAKQARLANVSKDKLDNLSGISSGYFESLPQNVKRHVIILQDLQRQHDEHEAKFMEERADLVAKYQKLYAPLYEKRYNIVCGIVDIEPPAEAETPEANVSSKANNTEEKGVPDFWLTAMKTNDVLGEEITKRDEGPLKYLKDIRSVNLEGKKGFKLEFHFAENPYFNNTLLTKVYNMVEDDEPICEHATGTEIEWYPGKNVTQKVLQKKPKKGSRNTKIQTKIEDCDSFFNFFDPPKVPEDDENLDEATAEELQDLMERDYDIGSIIKDKIIPHAVSWYTGEALQGDEFEEDEEEEDEEEAKDEE